MYSKDLTNAAKEISDRFEGSKRVELQALVEKVRVYPNGFEFSRDRGGHVDKFRVLSAFISGIDVLNAHICYRCEVLSWDSWSEHSIPLSEVEIATSIKHFPQEV